MLDSTAHWARQELFPRISLAHIGALILLLASGAANMRYGLSLGTSDFERMIGASASIGADLINASGFVILAAAWGARKWGRVVAMGFLLVFGLTFATMAGVGFASETRAAHTGERAATSRADTTRINELAKIDKRLAEIGSVEPADTLKARMDAILADPRATGCNTLDGKYTKLQCPTYFSLRAEHAKAVERDQLRLLRAPLLAGVISAKTVESADPAAENIARYLGKLWIDVDPRNLGPWQVLLFVVLVVFGGPLMLWLAEVGVPAREQAPAQQTPTDAPEFAVNNDNTPPTRPRRVATVTPIGGKVISRLEKMGGVLEKQSQRELAEALKVPRTSYRRIIDQLEQSKVVTTSHGLDGYRVRLVA